MINEAQSNDQLIVEHKFIYHTIRKYLQQILKQAIAPNELSFWCKQFTDIFIMDQESFNKLLDLSLKTAINLLMKFKNNPDIIKSGQFEMEIYVAYREEVYESSSES